ATLQWLTPLDDAEARLTSTAERALLRKIEGGCQVPLGALATVRGGALELSASVCSLDGSRHLSARGVASASAGAQLSPGDAVALGERSADESLSRAAADRIAREREARAVEEP